MKIDLSTIDQDRFHLNPRSIPGLGDFVLLVPHKAMWEWKPGEEHLRSLLCRPDGTVVSAGFPKFFNFGERADQDALTLAGLEKGTTSFTAKADGSLIIRSVIDGQVHFRTRGCDVIASDMKDAVEGLIKQKYPQLLDPTNTLPNSSFLMEYVGPTNQIVVKYDEAKLIGLGWVNFEGDNLAFCGGHASMALAGVEPIWTLNLPRDIRELRNAVSGFSSEEGIVTWTPQPDGTIHMSKFKSAWYLRLHALRSQATPRYLREFCYFNKIRTLDQLKEAFYREGFDWEIVSYVEPMFEQLRSEMEAVEKRLRLADDSMPVLKAMPTRKDLALSARHLADTSLGEDMFGYLMSRAVGEDAKADEVADALRLGMGLAQFRNFKKVGIEKLGAGRVHDDG